jgi:hypothetical protein
MMTKELNRLRRENEELRSAAPELTLLVRGEGEVVQGGGAIRMVRKVPELLDPDAVAEEARARYPVKERDMGYAYSLCNSEALAYPDKLRRYVKELNAHRLLLARSFEFEPILRNTGTQRAVEIDVTLTFPDAVKVVEAEDVPEPPEIPTAPQPPQYGVRIPDLRMPDS